MKAIRIVLVLCGIGFAAWGIAGLFGEQSLAELRGLAVWLGAALIVHDGVLAPLLLLVGVIGWRLLRRWPRPVRQVVATGALVAGLLALLAVPLIVRHPVASNPSALPQAYGRNLGWLAVVVVGATGLAALWAWLRWRRAS